MSQQPLIKCSVNRSVINKTADFNLEPSQWVAFEGTAKELLETVVLQGHAINQSLFEEGKARSGTNATGGNLCVLDLDDGITYEQILASPTYQANGVFIYASASCGVIAPKKGVDGRERWRVGFLLEREVATDRWTEDEGTLRLGKQRQHLERIACAKHLADNFCCDVGVPKLQDNCHNSVSQIFYGNDGHTPVTFDRELEDGSCIKDTYPCSTEQRFHINSGYLPTTDIDLLVEVHKLRHPEIYEPLQRKSNDEQENNAALARWIFDNDLLNEDQLTDRDICIKQIVACARGLGDDLLDHFMGTMERVMDGHHWRMPHALERAWNSYSEVSSFSIATLIHFADEASPGWKADCPYMGGKRYPVAKLSECFSRLKSTRQDQIII